MKNGRFSHRMNSILGTVEICVSQNWSLTPNSCPVWEGKSPMDGMHIFRRTQMFDNQLLELIGLWKLDSWLTFSGSPSPTVGSVEVLGPFSKLWKALLVSKFNQATFNRKWWGSNVDILGSFLNGWYGWCFKCLQHQHDFHRPWAADQNPGRASPAGRSRWGCTSLSWDGLVEGHVQWNQFLLGGTCLKMYVLSN